MARPFQNNKVIVSKVSCAQLMHKQKVTLLSPFPPHYIMTEALIADVSVQITHKNMKHLRMMDCTENISLLVCFSSVMIENKCERTVFN